MVRYSCDIAVLCVRIYSEYTQIMQFICVGYVGSVRMKAVALRLAAAAARGV